MGLLEWLGLKKREPVVCAECKFHKVKTSEYVTLEKKHYIHDHICNFKQVYSIDFISGKKTTIDLDCKSLNSKGNCRHFTRKVEWGHGVTFECAECDNFISPHCDICNATSSIIFDLKPTRSVLNSDNNCCYFIPIRQSSD